MDFETWMEAVDRELENLCGFSSNDLPDFLYRDAFNDGATPKAIAEEVFTSVTPEDMIETLRRLGYL